MIAGTTTYAASQMTAATESLSARSATTKDKAEKDAYKCADYLCRAVTGEWLEVEDAS